MFIDFIDIELDKPRKMALPLGALMRAERELNKRRAADGLDNLSIFRVVQDQIGSAAKDGGISAELMMVMLWASLLHEDPNVTIEFIERQPINSMYCLQKIFECIQAWMIVGKNEVGEHAESPLAQQNGSGSGQHAESISA